MKVNRRGITRTVFIFKSFVIKVPNGRYSWSHFLQGLIANIKEGQSWRYNKHRPEIQELMCPVIWTSWGGWILIMKRADVEGYCDYIRSLPRIEDMSHSGIMKHNTEIYSKWINNGFGGDDKADNYGFLNGKLVKVDYP